MALKTGSLLSVPDLGAASSQAHQAFEGLLTKSKSEDKYLGWVELPFSEVSLKESKAWALRVKKNQNHLCVLGMGGSQLGAQAVYDFISPKKKISFFNNVDGFTFENQLRNLDLKKTHFLAVSKSGETSETLIQLAQIFEFLNKKKLNFRNHISVITEDKKSSLSSIADRFELESLSVPVSVGGRFSVLCNVGLAPLVWSGVDCKKILEGAKKVRDMKEEISSLSDFFLDSFKKEKWISCFWFYGDRFKTLGLWFEQLWSESLAKSENLNGNHAPRASTPLICYGSNDQHSLLQQFNEGAQDKSFLFIRNLESEKSSKIKNPVAEELGLFKNKSVGELLGIYARATQKILKSKNAPVHEVIIQDHSPQSIGALIYFFELLVAVIAERMEINAYNQPGVEAVKRVTLGTLGDVRYSDLALKPLD